MRRKLGNDSCLPLSQDLLTASDLIRVVQAIRLRVALVGLGNALSAAALELVVSARGIGAGHLAVLLIGVVHAVVLSVATPRLQHALVVAALELVGLASVVLAAAGLIGAVGAVEVSVADGRPGNAVAVHASRLVDAASLVVHVVGAVDYVDGWTDSALMDCVMGKAGLRDGATRTNQDSQFDSESGWGREMG